MNHTVFVWKVGIPPPPIQIKTQCINNNKDIKTGAGDPRI